MPCSRSPLQAPLLPVALGFASGLLCSVPLEPTRLLLGLLAALMLFGLSLGGVGGRCLSSGALGAALLLGAPGTPPGGLDGAVTSALVTRTTPWSQSDGPFGSRQWTCTVEVLSLRQRFRSRRGGWRAQVRLNAEEPPAGRVLWLRAWLRPPPQRRNAPPGLLEPMIGRGRLWTLQVKSDRLVQAAPIHSSWDVVRQVWIDRLEGLGQRLSRFPKALLLGERSALADAPRRQLEAHGLGHLFALSGLHLGVLLGGLAVGFGWCQHRRALSRFLPWGLLVLTLLGVCAFLGVVGLRPSLMRASVAALAAFCTLAAGRRPWAFNVWAVALSVCLIWRPADGLSLGLQLSFLATAGILWSVRGPRAGGAGLWAGVLRRLRSALSVSMSAQIATSPLTAGVFHSLPLAAPILNLLFVPCTALVLLVSLAVCLGLPVPESALALLVLPFETAAHWPTRPNVNLPTAESAGVVAALVATAAARHPGSRRAVLTSLLLLLVIQCQPLRRADARVFFYDVGQGDAALVRSSTRSVLIDGGGWWRDGLGRVVLLPALLRDGVRTIDLMVLSHADRDHCGGLVEIAARLRVRTLWAPARELGEPCGAELAGIVGRQGGVVLVPPAGAEFLLGEGVLRVLPSASGASSRNDRSLLVELEAHGRTVWFLGDAGKQVEERLVGMVGDRRIDVLKVGHHGSKTSTGSALLAATRPRHALIGVGSGNVYGHPSQSVSRRLRASAAAVWRTDHHGRIVLRFARSRPVQVEVMTHPASPNVPL